MKGIRSTALCLLVLMLVSLCAGLTSCTQWVEPETRDLIWGVGAPLPEGKDFFSFLPEGATAKIKSMPDVTKLGEYDVTVTVKMGVTKRDYRVRMTLIHDEEPPVFATVDDLSCVAGEAVAYYGAVSVRDNCGGEITVKADHSAVDTSVPGTYQVIYTATDRSGNTALQTVKLFVYESSVTREMLFDEIDRVIAERIPTEGSVEAQAREIFQYVYYHVSYVGTSDKTDWVREAYRGLTTGQGDCFTYFALSKAFFERLGIENMDIQRATGIVDERHYWNYVNIGGTGSDARWYHFDACQLVGGTQSCLLTDEQIREISLGIAGRKGTVNYFYVYDAAGFPAASTEVISPID